MLADAASASFAGAKLGQGGIGPVPEGTDSLRFTTGDSRADAYGDVCATALLLNPAITGLSHALKAGGVVLTTGLSALCAEKARDMKSHHPGEY